MSPALGPPRITGTGVAGPDDLYWELRAQKLERDALQSIRSTAGKWVASIGTLTGVFGIVALIKGRDNINELTRGWEITAGVLVGASLGLAAIAIALAALAAQGSPRLLDFTGEELRRSEQEQAATASAQLALSRITAILAVLMLGTAIAMTWAGKAKSSEPKPSQALLVVSTKDAVACGSLVAADHGQIQVKTSAGTVKFRGAAVKSLASVAACP